MRKRKLKNITRFCLLSVTFKMKFQVQVEVSKMNYCTHLHALTMFLTENIFSCACEGHLEVFLSRIVFLLLCFCIIQFLRVIDACASFLSKSLHLGSCIGILNLADSHALPALRTITQDYITSQFAKVVDLQDFLELPAESLEVILQRDDLNVQCEECVFEALMRWVRARQDERLPLLVRLLSHVRLPLLEPAYFVEKVESDELIRNCSEAFPLLQEARTYHLSGREVSMHKRSKSGKKKNLFILQYCHYDCSSHQTYLLTGGLRANQTSCAALSVRGLPDHWGLHKR